MVEIVNEGKKGDTYLMQLPSWAVEGRRVDRPGEERQTVKYRGNSRNWWSGFFKF
jgi:hypothetical protein